VVLAVLAVTLAARDVRAQVAQTLFRADDGTAYQVLRATTANVRITTIAGSLGSQSGCTDSGVTITAIYGPDFGPGLSLVPYSTASRSAIVTPNSISSLGFDQHYGGRVSLGTGTGTLNVCQNSFDCSGQSNAQTTVALSSTTGGVSAGCTANDVTVSCDARERSVFGFGLSSSGNPPFCTTNPTVQTGLCASTPSDGFTLMQGQAIVFAYSSLQGNGFSVSYTEFTLAPSGGANGCTQNQVYGAGGAGDSAPAPALPTATPVPTCGDGVVNQPSEQCDGTPCCSASCTFQASGTTCNDGNLCTTGDQCDGAGHCGGTCAVGTNCTAPCGQASQCHISNGTCTCG